MKQYFSEREFIFVFSFTVVNVSGSRLPFWVLYVRPGFEGCSENMNDPRNVWFDCSELDEIFPDYKN